MDIKRAEIMPGVWLNHLRSDKFKTACMSVSLLTQLSRETASMNALIPFVLRRGTKEYADMEAISNRLDELYGSAIEPVVRRIGEIQCLGFYASIPEEDYLPKGESVLQGAAELMGQLLLKPCKNGKLLREDYVESEKEKLLELIRSRINEKRGYALFRCIEEMCCYEDFAVSRYGCESDCENITCEELSEQYLELIHHCPIELFYCGKTEFKKVKNIMKDALAGLPRGEINYDIGTDVRMNTVEENPRYVEEELNVTQGKLVMGFRLGECMEDPDLAALYVFNAVFGSGTTSKLFMNVREKLSLCYYAGSLLDTHKGLMFVSSGIEFEKFEAAKDEILFQLDEIRKGNVSAEELGSAKAGIASDLRSMSDVQGDLEGFYLANTIDGLDCSPEELAAVVEEVELSDVMAIANSIELDLIYFLTGSGEEDDEDED